MNRRLMLHAGGGSLSAFAAIVEHLRGARNALMIPYAQSDHDAATAMFADRLAEHGVVMTGIHTVDDPAKAMAATEAVFVTGGNSFRLVNALHRRSLIGPVREAIDRGIPYFGASAGANVASPSIRTTNDMPIVQPPSFESLNLVPFQINAHYIDPDPHSTHKGETREERIREFLEENDVPVVGLREGSILRVEDGTTTLLGDKTARIFRRGAEAVEVPPGKIDV